MRLMAERVEGLKYPFREGGGEPLKPKYSPKYGTTKRCDIGYFTRICTLSTATARQSLMTLIVKICTLPQSIGTTYLPVAKRESQSALLKYLLNEIVKICLCIRTRTHAHTQFTYLYTYTMRIPSCKRVLTSAHRRHCTHIDSLIYEI